MRRLVLLFFFWTVAGDLLEDAVEGCQEREGTPWIFVRGLHHSGTTLTTRIVGLHPAMIPFRNTHSAEDEGQHLQTVFPEVKRRFGTSGSGKLCRDDTYRCPSFYGGNESWAQLCSEWLPILLNGVEVDDASMYLEKTPDLSITFLATAARKIGRVLFVLRHPFFYRYTKFVVGGKRSYLGRASQDGRTVYCGDKRSVRLQCVAAWTAISSADIKFEFRSFVGLHFLVSDRLCRAFSML